MADAVNLHLFILLFSLTNSIAVKVIGLVEVAYVTEVNCLIVDKQWFLEILVVQVDTCIEHKDEPLANNSLFEHVLFVDVTVDVLELQRGRYHGHQRVVSFVMKFWIVEECIELLLEPLQKILPYHFLFHNITHLLVELILGQEMVGALLEILQGKNTTLHNDLSLDLLIDWHLAAHLDHQVLR